MRSFISSLPAVLSLAGVVASQSSQQSSGCGKPVPEVITLGKSKNLTIDSSSDSTGKTKQRKYRIHLPESYDSDVAVPLIFSFHGRKRDMKFQDQLSQFSNVSYGFEGIAVYPEGVPSKSKGTKQWQGDPAAPDNIDDVKFTTELLDHLLDRYCIDPARVYASGKSNGGGFTGLLACDEHASERITAFAAVSGAWYLDEDTQEPPPCKPATKRDAIPFMELHGIQDNRIAYEGGPNHRGTDNTTNIPDYVNAWAKRDGFDPNANKTGELCSGDKKVTTFKWDETVEHYAYANMLHDWPSEFGNKDTTNTTCAEADATRVILDWFKKWSL